MADTKVLSPAIPSQDEVMTESQQQVQSKFSSTSTTQSPTSTPNSRQFSKICKSNLDTIKTINTFSNLTRLQQ